MTNLTPEHLAQLYASAISDEVIHQRGYRSINDPAELAPYGFNQAQRRRSCPVIILTLPELGSGATRELTRCDPSIPTPSRACDDESHAHL